MAKAQRSAESLFDEFVARSEAGEGPMPDLEALCRQHPTWASELRACHEEWLAVRELEKELRAAYGAVETRDAYRDELDVLLKKLKSKASVSARYRKRDEIGRGGMGVVWRAWDDDLGRDVAMKVIRGAADGSSRPAADVLARFLAEAQITGRLDHPGVVSVHDLGLDDDGHPYFTMNLVRGESLHAVMRGLRDEAVARRAARIVPIIQRVVETLDYVHAQGVLHRDLKPSNIMVGRFGEVSVMDWGLAKLLPRAADAVNRTVLETEDPSGVIRTRSPWTSESTSPLAPPTLHGAVLGTPAYMAPEQASAPSATLDPRADVYSVGALLYEAMSGAPPYCDGEGPVEAERLLERLTAAPPTALDQLTPGAPTELVAICAKAMSRNVDLRYRSMSELGADLRAFSEERVVEAHAHGARAEFVKWVRRNRGVAWSAAALVLSAFLGAALFGWQEHRQRHEMTAKNRELTDARVSESAQRREAERKVASLERVARRFEGVFDVTSPAEARGRPVLPEELLERATVGLASDLQHDPPALVRLAATLGAVSIEHGRMEEAVVLLRSAERALDEIESPDLDRVCAMYGALCRALTGLSRFEEAEQALEALEARLGSDAASSHRAALLTQRGEVWLRQDRYVESEEAFRAALPWTNGSGRRSVVNGLSLVYARTNRFDDAARLIEREAQRAWQSLGEDHPETLRLRHNLADALFDVGDFDRGVDVAENVYLVSQRVFGVTGREALSSANSLALGYWETGRVTEARDLAAESFAATSTLEEGDLVRLTLRRTLASMESAMGRHAEARDLYLADLQVQRRLLTEDDARVLVTLNNLGRTYAVLGEREQALEVLGEAVALARTQVPPDVTRTVPPRQNLAALYLRMDRASDAVTLLEEALDECDAHLSDVHPLRIQTLAELATAYAAAGDVGAADEGFDEAVDLARDEMSIGHPLWIRVFDLAAHHFAAQGDEEEAVALLGELFDGAPEEHPDRRRWDALHRSLR